jgi:hypothetical protein
VTRVRPVPRISHATAMTEANPSQFIVIDNLSPYQVHYQTTGTHGRSAGTVPPASPSGVPPTAIIRAGSSDRITSFEARAIGGSGVATVDYPAPPNLCVRFEFRRDGSVQRSPCVPSEVLAPRAAGLGMVSFGATAARPAPSRGWAQSLYLANRTAAPITVNVWYTDGVAETGTVHAGLTRLWTSSGPGSIPPQRRMTNYAISTAHWGTGMLPIADMACISLAATDHGLVHNPDGPPNCFDGGDGMGGAGFNPSGRGIPHIM